MILDGVEKFLFKRSDANVDALPCGWEIIKVLYSGFCPIMES